jgi:intein/homing endonuclease
MYKRYDYDISCLTNCDDISYYLLGAFITDGCVYKTSPRLHACQLTSKDKDWLEKILPHFGKNLSIHSFRDTYHGIRIIRDNFAQWFINHGCVPRKTLITKYPKVPEQYEFDFIRGLIDGDGSIGLYNGSSKAKSIKMSLVGSSIDLINGVSDVLTKHEILHRIREKIQTKPNIVNGKPIIQRNPCYELNLSGKNAFKLMNLMYSNSRLHMPRKYNIYLSIVDYLSTYKDGRIYK